MGAGPGLWASVGPAGAPRPPGTTGPGPEVRVRPGTGCFRHGAAAVVRSRFRSRRLGVGQDGGRARFESLALQHFYRTAGFLAGVRQDLETKLFRRDLNLFNQTLDVVFIDTTSLGDSLPGHGDGVAASGVTPGTIDPTCPSGCCASPERHRLAYRLGDFPRQHRRPEGLGPGGGGAQTAVSDPPGYGGGGFGQDLPGYHPAVDRTRAGAL